MKTEITKLPKSQAEIKVEVSSTDWQACLEKAARELSKNVEIKGFRPGLAPFSLVEEKLGLAQIFEKAAQICIEKYYPRAILENKIEAIGRPEISILKMAKGSPFEFKARVAVLPSIDLPDYKDLVSKIKREKISVSDKEIEDTLSWLQQTRAKLEAKEGSCQKDDWVELEYSSPLIEQGKKFEDAFILGKGRLVPGFEDNLLGMKEGEEKNFPVLFPKDYARKELAGKEINFSVKVKAVKKVKLPALNDDFAKILGRFDNLEALKKNIKEGIFMEKEKAEKERIRAQIMESLSQKVELEIPEILIKEEQSHILEETKENIKRQLGLSFEDYLKKANKTEEEVMKELLPIAQKRIKSFIALREISKKEKIEVSEEELLKEVNEVLKKYAEAPKLDPQKLKEYTKERLVNEKTLNFLEGFID